MRNMHTAFKLVESNLQDSRKRMKEQYDRRAKELKYEIGDKVLLDVRVTKPGLNRKFTAKYQGPYRILQVNSNATVKIVNSNNQTQLVHVNRLKPLFETMLWKDEVTDPYQAIGPEIQPPSPSEDELSTGGENTDGEHGLQQNQPTIAAESSNTNTRLRPRRTLRKPIRLGINDTN